MDTKQRHEKKNKEKGKKKAKEVRKTMNFTPQEQILFPE